MIVEPEYSTSLKPKPTDGRDLEPVQNSSILLVIIIIIAFFLTSFHVLCEFSESANKEQGTPQPRHVGWWNRGRGWVECCSYNASPLDHCFSQTYPTPLVFLLYFAHRTAQEAWLENCIRTTITWLRIKWPFKPQSTCDIRVRTVQLHSCHWSTGSTMTPSWQIPMFCQQKITEMLSYK